jgi:hypothetical protein
VGCLYCGKEIGPFRILRDSEFCSSVHRKSYGERLGRALGKLGAPEPAPAGIAAFQGTFPIQQGHTEFTPASGYLNRAFSLRVVGSWPVAVPPTLGGSFRQSETAACALLPGAPAACAPPTPLRLQMPRFELTALDDAGKSKRKRAPAAAAKPVEPPACPAFMPLPEAQAAERFLDFAFTDAIPSRIRVRRPRIDTLGLRGMPRVDAMLQPPICETPRAGAQPAERFVHFAPFAEAIPARIPARSPRMESLAAADIQ